VKRLLAVIVGLALALIGTVAVAAWLSSGSASGSVAAASLAAPTDVRGSSTAGTGQVHVSWTGSDGTPTPTGYYVLRSSRNDSVAACNSSAAYPVDGTSCTDSSVPLGSYTYTVVAVFHSWTSASEPSGTVTVSKADQTITFGALVDKVYGDADFSVSATADSGQPVTFSTTTTTVCTVTSAGSVHIVGGGTPCTITASQAGNPNYNAATSVSRSFSVAKASQTITFGVLGDKVFGDVDFSVSATADSGQPVTFSTTTTSVCTVTSAGSVHIVGAGTPCTITASQAGNPNYNAATSVSRSFTVTASIALTCSTSGNQLTLNWTYSPNPTTKFVVRSTGSIPGTPADVAANLRTWTSAGFSSRSGEVWVVAVNGTTEIESLHANYAFGSGTGNGNKSCTSP
jgi:hypothetical protein